MGEFRDAHAREDGAAEAGRHASRRRYVNEGFSGGEKKRLEMLQMAVLQPEFADPRRDRLGPRHRRAADRRRGRQRPAEPGPGCAAHHPLPAPARLHQARRGPRPGARPDHQVGRRATSRSELEQEGYAPILREAGFEVDPSDDEPDHGAARRRRTCTRDAMSVTTDHLDTAASSARDFPLFERDFGGRSLAYLDSAATSLKPQPVLDALEGYNARFTANVHRGIYTTGEEATAAYEEARRSRPRRSSTRPTRTRSCSCATRPRPSTSSPTPGAAGTSRGRHDRADGAGAPLQPRALAAARPGAGRGPGVRGHRRATAGSTRSRSRCCCARGRSSSRSPQVSNALGTINPVREMVDAGPRRGRAGARRRRPGRAPLAGRRAGDRRRLLRVLGPQGARRRPARGRCGRAASCSRRCRRSWAVAR